MQRATIKLRHGVGHVIPEEQPSHGRYGAPSGSNELSLAERRARQRLEQEQATFDQKKAQDARWFVLKLAMGILAMLIIPTIVGICASILYDPTQTANVKSLAAGALLVDILGLVAAVWRVILNPASVTQLAPITEVMEDSPMPVSRKGVNRAKDPQ